MSAAGHQPPLLSTPSPDEPGATSAAPGVMDEVEIHWVELAPLFRRDAIADDETDAAPALPPAPVVSAGRRYVLCEQLAEGGMGAVYLGRQIGDGGFEREVVLKRLRSELAVRKDLLSLFLAEARLLTGLSHPGIVRALDLLKLDGAYYLVMEYVRGGDLRRLQQRARRRGQKLSAKAALFIGRELLSALDYAHHRERGVGERRRLIIHGDVSPSNILLSEHGEVKLTDFGIVRAGNTEPVLPALTIPTSDPEGDPQKPGALTGERTSEGPTNPRLRTRGKVGYMSPEQARGEALDARSDLFSLGVVLYELLTGQRLFIGASSASPALVYGVGVEPPSRHCPELPAAFDAVLLRALSLRREDRYPTAQALYKELLALSHKHGLLMDRAELAEHLRDVCGGDAELWSVLEERTGTARIDLDEHLDLDLTGREANLTVVSPRQPGELPEAGADYTDPDEATSPRPRRTGELRMIALPSLSHDSGEEISEAGITVPFATVPHRAPQPPRVNDDTQPLPPISNHTQPLPTHEGPKVESPKPAPLPVAAPRREEEADEGGSEDDDSDSSLTTARHLALHHADAAARKRELSKRHRRRLVDVLWGVLWGVLVGAILFSLISSGRC